MPNNANVLLSCQVARRQSAFLYGPRTCDQGLGFDVSEVAAASGAVGVAVKWESAVSVVSKVFSLRRYDVAGEANLVGLRETKNQM